MVAGFETPTSGTVRVEGKDITGLRPNQRNVGMVFQSYALFPNMTVADNVAFGLKVARLSKAETDARVGEMLQLIKLPHLAKRFPYQLSGGQQQRVALARALANKPKVLLLDEPLSALDAKIRVSLREEIRALQQKLGITTIFVTHDQEEALSMSDRIVVLNEGRSEQVGTPAQIYNRPATRFVASFIGTLSLLRAGIVDPQQGILSVEDQKLRSGKAIAGARPGDTWSVALRPESLTLVADDARTEDQNRLRGTIEEITFLGSVVRTRLRVGSSSISIDAFNNPSLALPERGSAVSIRFAPEDLLVLERATS
jgi:putative spermidine/putrescine transport system ATP-binding protein